MKSAAVPTRTAAVDNENTPGGERFDDRTDYPAGHDAQKEPGSVKKLRSRTGKGWKDFRT